MKRFSDIIVDEYLVMQCQGGDTASLSLLVSKWQAPLLRYASIMVRDKDLAKDVVQDAWLKIIRALPRLNDPSNFKSWAYRIVTNQSVDALRKAPQLGTPGPEPSEAPIKVLEEQEHVSVLLEQLSHEHRSVIALFYLQGFEVSEIASILDKPVGTIKSRLHHARERFRELLDDSPTRNQEGEQDEQHRPKNSGGIGAGLGVAGTS